MSTHTILPAAGLDLGFFSTKLALPIQTHSSISVLNEQFPSLAPVSTPMQDLPSFNRPDGCTVRVGDVTYFVGQGVHQKMDGSGMTRSSNPDYSQCSFESFN